MSAASNNDLFFEIDEQFSRDSFDSSNRSAQRVSNASVSDLNKQEKLIDIDGFSLNQEELIEEIRRTQDNIKNKDAQNLTKTSNSILREASNGDLNISIQLSENNSNSSNNNNRTVRNNNIKKRNSFLAKLFGPSKAEREMIQAQEALQREELRKKASLILSKDKEQKIRVLRDSQDEIINRSSNSNTINQQNEQFNSTQVREESLKETIKQNNILQSESTKAEPVKEEVHDIVRTYQPLKFSAYNENIKQLELKISHFNLVLGKNILPDRFKRRKKYAQTEAKEELSEIDKLYLAAFSDVSIPEEDIDLDEDSIIIDDPTEIEDLFDLADESLTSNMESAILSQISNLKQDIAEDTATNVKAKLKNETENIINNIPKKPISEVRLENTFSGNQDTRKRTTTRIIKKDLSANTTINNNEEKNANLFVRYSAFLVDLSFLVLVCIAVSSFIIKSQFNAFGEIIQNPLYLIELGVIFVKSLIVISLVYYAISYTVFQTSLGLKLLSYKLKSIDGRRPKIRQIFVRVLCMPINFLLTVGILGQKSIHDRLSKTKLVKN